MNSRKVELPEEMIDRLISIVKRSDDVFTDILEKSEGKSLDHVMNESINLGERLLALWILQSLRIPYNGLPKTAEDMGIEITKTIKKR